MGRPMIDPDLLALAVVLGLMSLVIMFAAYRGRRRKQPRDRLADDDAGV